jgi:predicted membrane metal-binding protein
MNCAVSFVLMFAWAMGLVLAQGFWSTAFAALGLVFGGGKADAVDIFYLRKKK